MANYDNIIANATNAYNSTLAGYKTQLAQQQQAQAGVKAGYDQLQSNVLGGLAGSSDAAKQLIINQYTQEAGKQQLGLIGRGLGNTTIQNSIMRGLNESQALAQTDRLNKFANTAAGYQTQLGLAGLGYQGNALNANMQFAGQGLQYAGQGAAAIGNLGLGFAGLQNQQELQAAQFRQQQQMARLYGVGGGGHGGGISSYDGGAGQAKAQAPNTQYPYGHTPEQDVPNPLYSGGAGGNVLYGGAGADGGWGTSFGFLGGDPSYSGPQPVSTVSYQPEDYTNSGGDF